MRVLRRLRNFWILWVTTVVLVCFSNVVAQVSYRVTDLGVNRSKDNFNMVMGLNNRGWTENMDGVLTPPIISTSTTIVRGRAVLNIYGINIDLGTLGGKNSWTNYGGINDRGEVVGLAETSVPDPDGENFCAFGTKRTCLPFLWRDGHMMALPTLGGNNGQASAINNHGQIVGISETPVQDPGCSPSKPGKIISPAFWEKGEVRSLPTLAGEPDGFVQGINDLGQAVGSSGTCTNIATHAVLWDNDVAFPLADLGHDGSDAYAINNHGQIVGYVSALTAQLSLPLFGRTAESLPSLLCRKMLLPLPPASTTGAKWWEAPSTPMGWSHGFISQNGVMTALNTLIREDSNLFIIAASNINDRGQISGMAMVMHGPDKGKIHAILLTPVHERIGRSVADVARTRPESNLPANFCSHHLQRFGPIRFER